MTGKNTLEAAEEPGIKIPGAEKGIPLSIDGVEKDIKDAVREILKPSGGTPEEEISRTEQDIAPARGLLHEALQKERKNLSDFDESRLFWKIVAKEVGRQGVFGEILEIIKPLVERGDYKKAAEKVAGELKEAARRLSPTLFRSSGARETIRSQKMAAWSPAVEREAGAESEEGLALSELMREFNAFAPEDVKSLMGLNYNKTDKEHPREREKEAEINQPSREEKGVLSYAERQDPRPLIDRSWKIPYEQLGPGLVLETEGPENRRWAFEVKSYPYIHDSGNAYVDTYMIVGEKKIEYELDLSFFGIVDYADGSRNPDHKPTGWHFKEEHKP